MTRFRVPRSVLLLAAALSVAAAGEHLGRTRTPGGLLDQQMRNARASADSLIAVTAAARDAGDVGADAAVAVGYLERLRLGIGSPFRLMDYALQDGRLSDSLRAQVALAILARTASGEAYQTDPAALTRVAPEEHGADAALGRRHLALIESTVGMGDDPRVGELAVRLAYMMATAEGAAGPLATMLASRAAALARDRVMAREDARALLSAAAAERTSPLALLPAWRAARRFSVEAPPLEVFAAEEEAAAIRRAIALVPRLRRPGGAASLVIAESPHRTVGARAAGTAARPLLGAAAAFRLAELASVRGAPPQTPVVVAVDGYRRRILGAGTRPSHEAALARFVERARNEEALAAEYALLAAGAEPSLAEPALATMWAAVSMRTYAQERVWFPGHGGPTVVELRNRFGLSSVSFDETISPAWRPYYLRMLASAAADLHRVLPSVSLRGLGVHFGARPVHTSTLALHDPRTRTIHLPVETSAGTIAHELAHDLDWQEARSRFAMRGEYGTDQAVRERRGPLALSVSGLTTAALIAPVPENGYSPPHAQRPAEVFARSVDWFLAVALAREGRTNGYLSAVQDELLTGYAAVTPPDITGEAGDAVVRILEDMVFVDATARAAFLARYGRGRALAPLDLVRRVLELPDSARGRRTGAAAAARGAAGASDLIGGIGIPTLSGVCALVELNEPAGSAEAWRLRLLVTAAESRARGSVRARAASAEAAQSEPWLARAASGGPWDPAIVEREVIAERDELLEQLAPRSRRAALSDLTPGFSAGCRR